MNAGLLSSALARPQHQAHYGDEPSVFDLAAAYVFLNINGWQLNSSEVEAINAVLALAEGEIDEPGFSSWLIYQGATAPHRISIFTLMPSD